MNERKSFWATFKENLRKQISSIFSLSSSNKDHPFPELIPFETQIEKALKVGKNTKLDVPLSLINEGNWDYLKAKYPFLQVPNNHPLHFLYSYNLKKVERAQAFLEAGEAISVDDHEEEILRSFCKIDKEEEKLIKKATVINTEIAGFRYHDYSKKAVKQMLEMDPKQNLDLIPEPDNKFDPDAIKILWETYHLGYVPRGHSYDVSRALESAKSVSCYLKKYYDFGPINERAQISIRIDHYSRIS